jgi:hypothetical protein
MTTFPSEFEGKSVEELMEARQGLLLQLLNFSRFVSDTVENINAVDRMIAYHQYADPEDSV